MRTKNKNRWAREKQKQPEIHEVIPHRKLESPDYLLASGGDRMILAYVV